jgi:hypothetical protein
MYRKLLLSLLFLWVSAQSVAELFLIVFQPNAYRDAPSKKWIFIFVVVCLYVAFFLVVNFLVLWRKAYWQKITSHIQRKLDLTAIRHRMGWGRYALGFLLIVAIIYFFQYSLWGLIFPRIYLRLFFWLNLIYVLAFLLTENGRWVSWHGLFRGVVFSSIAFGLAGVFSNIVSYPFGLYWSDGNRIWDYSLIFGRELYNYPLDQDIYSLTSYGRQILWGIPFLLPNSTIWLNRLWSAILYSLPSMILGWIIFSTKNGRKRDALLLAGWAFLFLNQGPIYTPLTLSAILVALAWGRPIWVALPLIAVAGYYADLTRYTWFLAPAVWSGMLWLNGNKLKGVRPDLKDWGWATLAGASGLLWWIYSAFSSLASTPGLENTGAVATEQNFVSRMFDTLNTHPLLWERLLPNPTYPEGVLGALLVAIVPLGALLYVLHQRGIWIPSRGQWVTIWLPLLGFGAIGLVASTKIGGGNNLHNMDMFLITLLFVAAVAWRNGGNEHLLALSERSVMTKTMLLLAFVLPALPALRSFRPLLSLSDADVRRVQVLTGNNLFETLPAPDKVNDALWAINRSVEEYAPLGEVLFIDQRQLLTFGKVPPIPLVPEYEKKVLMNEALANDAEYFADYYEDLAAQRFSLILSEPLKTPDLERNEAFAEEGDVWTKWVAAPTLCFYEPIFTLKDVYVQLLVPREDVSECEAYLDRLGVLQ